ncbi:hypothetical protein QR680_000088 [Steinernema hermaphroditum]|uniref:Vitellogenin domain-containing protein n=1 Tax=Steinernema hermaphroditum TaxID=289476 RepID=A0AA39GTA9_9BILA|nr:hypothetical protein QR680_000088 [Steinernema hermaphroditum]
MFLKQLLWSCLLVGAVTASLPLHSIYTSGQEYQYHYDAQISHGLLASNEASLSRTQAIVKVNFIANDEAQVQLEHVKFGSVHANKSQEVQDIVDLGSVDSFEINDNRMMEIERPFVMKYHKGIVENIVFKKDESTWSKNVKKGIVNLLQVQTMEENGHVFSKTETTIEGECEALYTYTVDEVTLKSNVSKSINFQNCASRPVVRYDSQMPVSIAPCKEGRQSLIPLTSTVYEFILEDTHRSDNAIVSWASVRSEHIDSTAKDTAIAFKTVSLGELTLMKIELSTWTQRRGIEWNDAETLLFNTESWKAEEEWLLKGASSKTVDSSFIVADRVTMMTKYFNELQKIAKSSRDAYDTRAVYLVQQSTELLPYLKEDELKNVKTYLLDKRIYNKDELLVRTNLFIDLLIMSGDHNAVKLYAFMVDALEVPAEKTVQNVPQFLNAKVITDVTVTTVRALCEKQVIKTNKYNYHSCLLTWGALLNRVCSDNHYRVIKSRPSIHCTEDQKAQYVKEIMRMFESTVERYERIVYMKVLGNTGFEQVFDEVKHVILNPSESVTMRGQSIDALRLVGNKIAKEVHEILVPMILNTKEHTVLRINALYHVMLTNPPATIVNMLTVNLKNDPAVEIKGFMNAIVKELSDSKTCCDKELSSKMKAAMAILNVPTTQYFDHDFLRGNLLKMDSMQTVLNYMSAHGRTSSLPKMLMLGLDVVSRSETFKNQLAIGFEQENLDDIVAELQQYWTTSKLSEILVRGKRFSFEEIYKKPVGIMQNLLEKLHIVNRGTTPRLPYLGIHLRYRNFDTGFIQITPSSAVPEILNEVVTSEKKINVDILAKMISNSKEVHRFQITNMQDTIVKIPTVFGVDLKMSVNMPVLITVDGSIETQFESKSKQWSLTIEPKLNLHLMVNRFVRVETWTPLFSSGVMDEQIVSGMFPLFGRLEMTASPEFSLTVHIRTPHETTKLLKAIGGASAFIRKIPQTAGREMKNSHKLIEVQDHDQYTGYDEEFECKFTGLKFVVDAHYARHFVSDFPFATSGHKAVSVAVKPTHSRQNHISLMIKLSNRQTALPIEELNVKEITDMQHFHADVKGKFAEWSKSRGQQYKLTVELSNEFKKKYYVELKKTCRNDSDLADICIYKADLNGDLQSLFYNFMIDVNEQSWPNSVIFNGIGTGMEKATPAFKLITATGWPLREGSQSTAFAMQYNIKPRIKEMSMNFVYYVRHLLQRHVRINFPMVSYSVLKNDLQGNVTYFPLFEINFEMDKTRTHTVKVPSIKSSAFTNELPRGTCQIEPKSILTFDGLKYDTKLDHCYAVIAKDCGSGYAPKFAVLAKKMNHGSVNVKVITNRKELELYFDKENALVVRKDGIRVEGRTELRKLGIAKSSDQVDLTSLDLRDEGLKLWFGKKHLAIHISKEFRERQCGLCGHFNDDSRDVFRTAKNELTENVQEFVNSYILRDDQCETVDIDNKMEERDTKPTKVHRIFEFRHDVCFSKKMWNSCPTGLKPSRSYDRITDFYCFPRSEHGEIAKLRHLATEGEPLNFSDLEYTEVNHKITVPMACK